MVVCFFFFFFLHKSILSPDTSYEWLVKQSGFSSFDEATCLGERKILNSKSDKFCLENLWCTIFLLTAHSKSITGFTQVFTTINKNSYVSSRVVHIFN